MLLRDGRLRGAEFFRAPRLGTLVKDSVVVRARDFARLDVELGVVWTDNAAIDCYWSNARTL
jgi:hypothetical protein